MTTFWSFIGVAASIQGILLSITLFIRTGLDKKTRLYFSLLVLAFSLWLAEFSFYWSSYLFKYPQLAFTTISLPWLFGPLLYLINRNLTEANSKFELKYMLHFIPFVVYFGFSFNEFSADTEGKLELLQKYIFTQDPQLGSLFFLFNSLLFIQIIGYVLFTLIKIKNSETPGKLFLSTLSFGLLVFSLQKLIHITSIYFSGYKFIFEVGALLVLTSAIFAIHHNLYLHLEALISDSYKNQEISKQQN